MGRLGITFPEVADAIATLQGKQKTATVDNVREILGTGSKSTIARFLREWKAQRGLQGHDDGHLPSELLSLVNSLWESLQNKASAQIESSRQESEAKITAIQQAYAQTKQEEENLRRKIHTLEENLHQQGEEMQRLRATLTIETQEKIKLTERANAISERDRENHAENQRLHQLLHHVQKNLEHYQAATQKLKEEQFLALEKERQDYESKLTAMLARANKATDEKSTYQAELSQLKNAHEVLALAHTKLTVEYAEVHSQHELLKMTHDKMQEAHDAQTKQNQAQMAELATLQRTLIELQVAIKTKDEKIVSLTELLTSANDKIETLRHENQFALQEKANLAGQLKQLQAVVSSKAI